MVLRTRNALRCTSIQGDDRADASGPAQLRACEIILIRPVLHYGTPIERDESNSYGQNQSWITTVVK